jgi:hypothetical protein
VLNPLHVIEIYGQRLGHDSIRSPASRGENVVDPLNGALRAIPTTIGAAEPASREVYRKSTVAAFVRGFS